MKRDKMKEGMDLILQALKEQNFTLGQVMVIGRFGKMLWDTSNKILIGDKNDSKNEVGVQGCIKEGEKSEQIQPVKESSREETPAG